jgi:sulfur transfer protein SufE
MLPTLDEIFEEFVGLDREDQSQFLLELGDELPAFPATSRVEQNKVHGCQSPTPSPRNKSRPIVAMGSCNCMM